MILPAACARKLRVEREIRAGGSGTVPPAAQLELDRRVALELLHAQILEELASVYHWSRREAP